MIIGEDYYVRVYSFSATPQQNSTFDICVFSNPTPITTSVDLYTVEELITDILIDSDCDQAFNVTYSTGTNFQSPNGIGYFESNGGSWPFENGLILSSGDVLNAGGPETGVLADGGYDLSLIHI